jgi:hypothetical protein
MSCATSVTYYFFYFAFINLIFLNIKLLSSDFYLNGIGLVLTKQCHFIENYILNGLPDVVTIRIYPLNIVCFLIKEPRPVDLGLQI